MFAVVYVAIAVFVIRDERYGMGGGGWINLRGLASWIATLPVSLPCELLGAKLDYRSNAQMTFAVGSCAVLAYLFGALLGRFCAWWSTAGVASGAH